MPDPSPLSPEEFRRKTARLERLSHVLDEAIRIPGTRFRIGADALIGLIPGIGDAAGALIGGYMIYEAHKLGAPGSTKWKMAGNVGLDALVGLVPVLGDVSDFVIRSNRRNMALLRAHLDSQRPQELQAEPGSPRRRWWPWVLATFAMAAVAFVGFALAT